MPVEIKFMPILDFIPKEIEKSKQYRLFDNI